MAFMSNDGCDLLCLDLPKAERLRAERLSLAEAQLLAERAKALGDPTRLTLAAALAETDELCVCDLAWIAERAENLVSHHLRTLRSAGLVGSRRDGKMVLYSLTPSGRTLLAALGSEAAVRLSRGRAPGRPARQRAVRRLVARPHRRPADRGRRGQGGT